MYGKTQNWRCNEHSPVQGIPISPGIFGVEFGRKFDVIKENGPENYKITQPFTRIIELLNYTSMDCFGKSNLSL